ncbi:MAG: hypothetical protein V8S81_00095 [Oscillospiraceae bacterium]
MKETSIFFAPFRVLTVGSGCIISEIGTDMVSCSQNGFAAGLAYTGNNESAGKKKVCVRISRAGVYLSCFCTVADVAGKDREAQEAKNEQLLPLPE